MPGAYHGRVHSNTVGAPPPRPGPLPAAGSSGPMAGIPQAGSDPGLFPLFRAVDTHGTGQLTEEELGKALRNGDYTTFDPETVRLMVKMFDHDHSGTVGFEEFWYHVPPIDFKTLLTHLKRVVGVPRCMAAAL